MSSTINCINRLSQFAGLGLLAMALALASTQASAQQTLSTTLAQQKQPAKTKPEVAKPQTTLLATVEIRSRIQRVARLYLEIAADSRTQFTIPLFTREVSFLDANMAKLDKAGFSGEEAKAYNRIRTRYDDLRVLFVQPYTPQNGDLVYATSEEMMTSAQKLAQLSAQNVDTDAAYALDVSGRVMAQTERIAKAFMQCALTQSRSSLVDLDQWRKEHATGLAQLADMKINDSNTNDTIRLSKMLNTIQGQFMDASLKANRCTVHTSMMRSSDAMWSILQSTSTRYFNQMGIPARIG